MEKNKKQPRKKIEIKKTLKAFLADEDGFVSKETILKVGLATVAGIGVFGAMSPADAGHTNYMSHSNTMNFTPQVVGGCLVPNTTHTNMDVPYSHNSY